MKNASRGFTIIELLIVVAVIGIIAAIAIPALVSAIHRAKQKRTMADVRQVAVAVESYAVDTDVFPQQALAPLPAAAANLEPTYSKALPSLDGWGNDMLYAGDAEAYTLVSLGRDGQVSGPASGPTTDFDDDLVFSGGSFIAWPAGIQE